VNTETKPTPLLPTLLANPWVLPATLVTPHLILLLLNLNALRIVGGDLSSSQHNRFAFLLVLNGSMLLAGAVLTGTLAGRRKPVGWLWNIPVLAMSVGYLWLATFWIAGSLLPASVTAWILPVERMMFWQFTFMMPGLFHAALRLSCFPVRLPRGLDAAATGAVTVALPLGWYLGMYVLGRLFNGLWNVAGDILMVMLVLSTVIMCMAFMRFSVILFALVRRGGEVAMTILTAIVGVVGPLGGLVLNAHIPFPADFQAPAVYIMAVLNGLVLLVPRTGRAGLDRAVFLLRCFFLSFTLYFFLVFLPFLPLSLLAVIAAGAGFLMLTPLVLFLVHGLRLAQGFQRERAALGTARVAMLALAAFLVMPAAYTLRAVHHHAIMHRAIAHVYEQGPDAGPAQTGGKALGTVLYNLRDRAYGLHLPYLSSYYDWIVFDNLVLPEKRIEYLHRFFLGTAMEPVTNENIHFSLFGGTGRRPFRGRTTPPPRTVSLSNLEVATGVEGPCEKSLLTVRMRNQGDGQAEFTTTLRIPEGVLVSGFWLYVNGERVPGRIFERKTAMWVYRMIRDVARRDPGLLVYRKPGTIDFSVFPFAGKEERTAEIELLYPAGYRPGVQFGDRELQLGDHPPVAEAVTMVVEHGGSAAVIRSSASKQLPARRRTPFIHFIIDRSVGVAATLEDQLGDAAAIAKTLPGIEQARVTLANRSCVDAFDGTIAVSELGQRAPVRTLKQEGGFARDRAIARVLAEHYLRQQTKPAAWLAAPLIVVLQDPATDPLTDDTMPAYARLVPDRAGFRVYTRPNRFQVLSFADREDVIEAENAVRILRSGGNVQAVASVEDGPLSVRFFDGRGGNLEVYDPGTGSFRPVDSLALDARSRYAQGLAAWMGQDRLDYHRVSEQAGLKHLVEISRNAGVLVPATSYIVVENSSQWEMLALKEKQKLDNPDVLEFMETPEPSTWVLLLGVAAYGLWRRRPGRAGHTT
jgi:hypothetical protein